MITVGASAALQVAWAGCRAGGDAVEGLLSSNQMQQQHLTVHALATEDVQHITRRTPEELGRGFAQAVGVDMASSTSWELPTMPLLAPRSTADLHVTPRMSQRRQGRHYTAQYTVYSPHHMQHAPWTGVNQYIP